MREGSLYRFLVDPMELIHSNERLDEVSRFEVAHAWYNGQNSNITKCIHQHHNLQPLNENIKIH
jgi:hypothetical protein